MGDTVQEILQRRGSQKRKGFGRIRSLSLLPLLFITYLTLLLGFPLKHPVFWAVLCLATSLVCVLVYVFKRGKFFAVELYLSLSLLIAGASVMFSIPWLRTVYFPFLVFVAFHHGRKIAVPVLLLIPFIEIGGILSGVPVMPEIAFVLSLAVTTALSLYLKRRKEREIKNPSEEQNTEEIWNAQDQSAEVDGKDITDYIGFMFTPEEEMKDILTVAKKVICADSVNFFRASASGPNLEYSTEGNGRIVIAGAGILQHCLGERKSYSVTADRQKIEPGYLKKEKIGSLLALPVMDQAFAIGVITADSSRVNAFNNADEEMLGMFAGQVVKTLRRERVYPQIQRSYNSLRILNEESSKLLSSLSEEVIVQNLLEGMCRVAVAKGAFFGVRGGKAEMIRSNGIPEGEGRKFSLKGTLFDMAARNREPVYIASTRDCRPEVLPCNADVAASVYMLPLSYEKELFGLVALLFEEENSLSPDRMKLLELLGKQASISMTNARLHAAIELSAVTDGLTGLFNHRHFQDRLTQEYNRLERFSGPLSLLLIDIDYFKKINDTYGHPMGDAVLKKVAAIIRKALRNIDIPARYGGEEFAVVLPGTDEKGAMKTAERLRKAVMGTEFTAEGEIFRATVSIGICTSSDDIKKREDIIQRSDKALYHAKHGGRNQSVVWSNSLNATAE